MISVSFFKKSIRISPQSPSKAEAISCFTNGVLDCYEEVLQKEVIEYDDIF